MMNKADMRARFVELNSARAAISAKVDPLHEVRAAIRRKSTEDEAKIAKQIKAASVGLSDIDEELGMISRALNGKTGAPVPDAVAGE